MIHFRASKDFLISLKVCKETLNKEKYILLGFATSPPKILGLIIAVKIRTVKNRLFLTKIN